MTPREERIYHLCNVGLGTKFHFLFECTSADVHIIQNILHIMTDITNLK
jgi:hypothetical protein